VGGGVGWGGMGGVQQSCSCAHRNPCTFNNASFGACARAKIKGGCTPAPVPVLGACARAKIMGGCTPAPVPVLGACARAKIKGDAGPRPCQFGCQRPSQNKGWLHARSRASLGASTEPKHKRADAHPRPCQIGCLRPSVNSLCASKRSPLILLAYARRQAFATIVYY
jgi:hypothetical protein